ncbi:MAG: cupin domain-containing protein [Pseudomonadota bacterium]
MQTFNGRLVMTILISMVAGGVLTHLLKEMPSGLSGAYASEAAKAAPPEVWNAKGLNKRELESLGDIDWTPVASGSRKNSELILFEGQNTVSLWDAGPAKLILDEPLTYDEFVVVLKGELVLTDNAGSSKTYKEGDMFMLPKGFVGTWDMTTEYRELIVVDTETYNAAY